MDNKKKIAIVGTAGVPARYGGFETLAHNLVLNLNDTYDIHVYASTKMYHKSERIKEWQKAKIHYGTLVMWWTVVCNLSQTLVTTKGAQSLHHFDCVSRVVPIDNGKLKQRFWYHTHDEDIYRVPEATYSRR